MTLAPRLAMAALVVALALSPLAGGTDARAQDAAAQFAAPAPVGVVVNGQAMAEPGLLVVRDGHLLTRCSDFAAWGLAPGAIPAQEEVEGESYVVLARKIHTEG